jgi:predicted small lipoprotein YifL
MKKVFFATTIVILLTSLLTGCGVKGKLTLPEVEAQQ